MKLLTYRQNILPDFLVIGAQKCATSSLHYYLACHPEISMSKEKELDFFIEEKNWSQGIDWYKSQFRGKAKIYGESSPNYTNYPIWQGVAAKIFTLKPEMKLIYILRDPIQRLISNYVHNYDHGRENLSFIEAIKQNNYKNEYIYRSRYYLQLEQFLEYFTEQNILIITTEKLTNFPEDTLIKICYFLNVSPDIKKINYSKILHDSSEKRRKNKIGNLIKKSDLISLIDILPPIIRYDIKRIIYFPFSQAIKKPNLTEDLRIKLTSLLEEDINKLKQYTGETFEQWLS